MDQLTGEQRNAIHQYLIERGLTFKPLLDEVTDHLACELEELMQGGLKFSDAFEQAVTELPQNHFQNLQKETMETIDKRFIYARGLSWLALALLFSATAFKVLHLPGAPELLIGALATLSASLLSGSLSGISQNRDKKGATRLLLLVVGVITLITSFGFTLFRLPGNEQMTIIAVVLVVGAGIANSLYVFKKATAEENLLTWLHEKYSPGIERFLLILFLPLVVVKVYALLMNPPMPVPTINLTILVVVYAAGLQFFASAWRSMEKNVAARSLSVLIAVIVAFTLLNLPFATSILNVPARTTCVILLGFVSAWLAVTLEEKPVRLIARIICWIFPVVFLLGGMLRMGVVNESFKSVIFNIPILLVLMAGVFLSRQNGIMRPYLILAAASYLFEYMM